MANSEANQGNADAPTQNAKKRPGKKHRAILDASQAQITAAIDAVVAECRRLGLVDDLRYAMGRAQTLARRGMSPMRIRQDLRFRGARDPIIAEVLEELAAGEAEVFAFDAARSYARRRRFGPYRSGAKDKGETNPAVLAKRELASMMRAGHRFELANAILGCDDRDQLEDAMNIDDIR
ncbi:MAG: RecX family transcriptional regulator [Pseudomonadota bacterium]